MGTTQTEQGTQVALIRHIVPIVLGTVVTLALTVVTANWLAARAVQWPLLLGVAYRVAFTILGTHLAARLAPPGNPRIRYALAVGVLLTVLSILAASAAWGQAPSWYLVSGIVLPVPCAIIGGGLAARVMAAAGQ